VDFCAIFDEVSPHVPMMFGNRYDARPSHSGDGWL